MKNREPVITEAYNKGIKIIDSCKNIPQLRTAKKYNKSFLNYFLNKYHNTYLTDTCKTLYLELYLAYEKKYETLCD
jgi:hypothetical protein